MAILNRNLMNRELAIIAFFFASFFSPIALYASGACELEIKNETGANIVRIVIMETNSNEAKEFDQMLKDKTSTVIKVKKEVYYDVILIDDKNHFYGKQSNIWKKKTARLTIKKNDFISQGLLDILKKLFGW
jgi:hypothetical protein